MCIFCFVWRKNLYRGSIWNGWGEGGWNYEGEWGVWVVWVYGIKRLNGIYGMKELNIMDNVPQYNAFHIINTTHTM